MTGTQPKSTVDLRVGEHSHLEPGADGVTVRVTFDAESEHPAEQQRQGWQALLNNFAKHIEAGQRMGTSARKS